MGLLVKGKWKDEWYDTTDGNFKREESIFRNFIGDDNFPAEKDRYHLYVSLACPWAHRTLIFRHLKSLEDIISISVVHPHMLDKGWSFQKDFKGATGDTLYGHEFLHQLYTKAKSDYTGRVTVPVLWDKKNQTIVSNESADIIRMLNSSFPALSPDKRDFYPEQLRGSIDKWNKKIYSSINNGAYKAGFATQQQPYEEAVENIFAMLDTLETHFAKNHLYLCGDVLTEADWRLFTSLIRFDCVYAGHFKCGLKRIRDYTHLHRYLTRLYNFEDVKNTVDFDHIKQHYYFSHDMINPTRIVPEGPDPLF